jgi:hypothetical protein
MFENTGIALDATGAYWVEISTGRGSPGLIKKISNQNISLATHYECKVLVE